jgi:hypothetical protein
MTYAATQQAFIDKTVATMKAEILAMFDEGVFQPGDVKSFADLHTYTDANCLGGMCDDSEGETLKGLDLIASIFPDPAGSADHGTINSQAGMDACNHMQDLVDAWIRTSPVWEGFGDGESGVQVINPTCSSCGRFAVDPSTYGFKPTSTGGNCEAWELILPDGSQCLITDEQGCSRDLEPGEKFILGIYSGENGDELAMYEGVTGLINPLRRIGS